MLIVDSFVPWLQVFLLSMTEPSGRLVVEFLTGWLFSPGRSLCDRIRASGQHSLLLSVVGSGAVVDR